jgi:predicted ester cyclase
MDFLSRYQAYIAAIEAGDFETVQEYLDDAYVQTGSTPEPIGKWEMLAYLKAIKAAFPDMAFNFTDLRGGEQGEHGISGRMHFTGTHKGELDLTFMGIPAQPATGRPVALPEEPVEAYFRDGRILSEVVMKAQGGGLEGVLQQIGAEIHA